jgi:hypothetical protein
MRICRPARKRCGFIPIIAILLITGTSCKDKKAFNQESAQSTVDLRNGMGEMDEVIKDINTVIVEQYTLRNRSAAHSPTTSVCGVKLDTTGQLDGRMTLIYDNTDCYGRTRIGKVRFEVRDYPLRKWKQKDCILDIEYIGYRVTRSSDGKSVKMEGSQTLRNESGNSWFEMMYDNSHPAVAYVLEGEQLKLTFNGDETALFSVSRRLNFSYDNGVTACRVEGLSSQLGRGSVEAWGQSTTGEKFAAEVTSPYTWKTTCGALAPVKGQVSVVHEEKDFDLKCQYGVDASGNIMPEGAKCPFGWETTWSRKKKTNSRLFGYY